LLEYYVKSYSPKSHIAVCEIIAMLGMEILADSFGDIESDEYYGFFHVKSDEEGFDILSDFPEVTIEIPQGKILR
jgi:hypothetical protein